MDMTVGRAARQAWRQFGQWPWQLERDAELEPRRTVLVDAALALVLSAVALLAAAQLHVGRRIVGYEPAAPGQSGPGAPVFGPLGLEPRNYLLIVLVALPLAVRRRYPAAAFWVIMCSTLIDPEHQTWATALCVATASYSLLAHGRNLPVVMGSFALAAVLAGNDFRHADTSPAWGTPIIVIQVAGLLAGVVRYWQLRLKASQQQLAELRRAQAEATRVAIEEERTRIAGELHDVVSHSVSVMVIQAGAARRIMDRAPAQSKEALLAVESSGRAAMSELRNVMGLLAASGTGDPQVATPEGLEPQPGLDQLDALVARVRAAGLTVATEVSLPAAALPPGVDLAAYRVVQEALTNIVKHASGASATIVIGHQDHRLRIEVDDTGGAPGDQAATGNGRGLIGMRERLAVYGGSLQAGPRPGGGFRICADLPWSTQ